MIDPEKRYGFLRLPIDGENKRPTFEPLIRSRALARRVLAVARTRIEGAWAAYIDAVPGDDFAAETAAVLDHGQKLTEGLARTLFPEFNDLPYAR